MKKNLLNDTKTVCQFILAMFVWLIGRPIFWVISPFFGAFLWLRYWVTSGIAYELKWYLLLRESRKYKEKENKKRSEIEKKSDCYSTRSS